MVEWFEAIRGVDGPELDLETAQCLADALKVLADCQKDALRRHEERKRRECPRNLFDFLKV